MTHTERALRAFFSNEDATPAAEMPKPDTRTNEEILSKAVDDAIYWICEEAAVGTALQILDAARRKTR